MYDRCGRYQNRLELFLWIVHSNVQRYEWCWAIVLKQKHLFFRHRNRSSLSAISINYKHSTEFLLRIRLRFIVHESLSSCFLSSTLNLSLIKLQFVNLQWWICAIHTVVLANKFYCDFWIPSLSHYIFHIFSLKNRSSSHPLSLSFARFTPESESENDFRVGRSTLRCRFVWCARSLHLWSNLPFR